jgi:protein KRI1
MRLAEPLIRQRCHRGSAIIQNHPRQVSSTVRREDTSRKDARERKKARKAEALARKNEDVKRLKALKLREIRKKLNIVSKESEFTVEGVIPKVPFSPSLI